MEYLSVEQIAAHWGIRPETVRLWFAKGLIKGSRVGRQWRTTWEDVWQFEGGPMPPRSKRARYMHPPLDKPTVAQRYRVSMRTVERWLEAGLPTRSIGPLVRINEFDVADWLAARYGLGGGPAAPNAGPRP